MCAARLRSIWRRLTKSAASIIEEERYRAIVEIQSEMICRWLPDKRISFVNDAYCRYFGASREALIGSYLFEDIYPEDLPRVIEMIDKVGRELPTVTYEYRVYNAKGEVRWQQWSDQAIFDRNGQIVEYQSAGRDITALKNAEEAEREQRQFAEALASTAALISSTLDLDEVLDRILIQVATVNPLNSAEIILLDGDLASIARSRNYSDPDEPDIEPIIHFSLKDTRNLAEMASTRRALIIPDVREYPGWIAVEVASVDSLGGGRTDPAGRRNHRLFEHHQRHAQHFHRA